VDRFTDKYSLPLLLNINIPIFTIITIIIIIINNTIIIVILIIIIIIIHLLESVLVSLQY